MLVVVWKFTVAFFLIILLAGCEKSEVTEVGQEPGTPDNPVIDRVLLKANKFVYDYTTIAYLWEDKIPSGITHISAGNPQDLFELMRYKELDTWSYVTDNSQEALDSYQGVYTTFGYSLAFGRFVNVPDEYFAVVQYVYPGSPAEAAGLERGDYLVLLDGQPLNSENYLQLIYGSEINVGFGEINSDGTIGLSGRSVSLKAVKMYEDPVVDYRIIETSDCKVGYLFYAGFYTESHEKLVEVFTWFKNEGVSDLILDLRYNLGGNALTPPFLASLIAPQDVVQKKSVFLTEAWNDAHMEYFKQKGEDLNLYFNPDIPVNLNLNRVYVLTTKSTASASEATISGLLPYMDVIKIGSKSYGKYCGAALISPKDSNGDIDKEIENWLLTLVIYKFVNANGFTEFKDGMEPDYPVSDKGLLAGIPLGDTADPLIAKALELITGESATKSSEIAIPAGVEIESLAGEDLQRGGMKKFIGL